MTQQDSAIAHDKLPLHGGDIHGAARRFNIPERDWLDLSTGINPQPYPVPDIPGSVFRNLPYVRPEFLQAVQAYYGHDNAAVVAGSQSAIQLIPAIIDPYRVFPVLLPDTGYREHQLQWSRHGQQIHHYRCVDRAQMIQDIDQQLADDEGQHLVVINPNNPTGLKLETKQLLKWAAMLRPGAFLIVDEAFIDIQPQESLLRETVLPSNVMVLRSFGKFFGLAGLRLGFVFSTDSVIADLQGRSGLWQINGPAQYIATTALQDRQWHTLTRRRLPENAAYTAQLFAPLMATLHCPPPVQTPFFLSYLMSAPLALAVFEAMAQGGVLTRVVFVDDRQAFLRIGCLGVDDSAGTQQLLSVLEQVPTYLAGKAQGNSGR